MVLWAAVHVATLFQAQLESNPTTIGLAGLAPAVEWVIMSKIEIVLLKNMTELLIGILFVPMTLTGRAPILFPILYFQYIRIKFVSNSFMKEAFKLFNQQLKNIFPVFIYDSTIMIKLRGHLWSYFTFEGDADKKKEQNEDKNSTTTHRDVMDLKGTV